MSRHWRADCQGFHRRDLLKLGVVGIFGLSLPQLLRLQALAGNQPRKADGVIFIWLAGGPSTIDMWDPRPEAPSEIRGEFKSIATRLPGVQFSEHLPRTAAIADKLTVIRSLAHSIAAHGPGTLYMTTGNKPTPTLQYPAYGSLCARLLPVDQGLPAYVSFGDFRNGLARQSGYLGPAYNPFLVEGSGGGKGRAATFRVRGINLPKDFSLADLEDREKLAQAFDASFRALDQASDLARGLDAFQRQALDILRSDKTRLALDLNREPDRLRERYGLEGFGQGVLAARRLIEAGVRFVTVSLGGWDTHQKNFETLSKRLLPQVDAALSALIADLDERGLLQRTVVYCAGEFGRTPRINKNAGRDHWARSMAVVLAGGGFQRGMVYGSTDPLGMAPASSPCSPDDVAATLFHCLGIDPHQELLTPGARPVQLFREGQVLSKVLI